MGTETRIGIVAGLMIVVIASVYFYYGQSRLDQELVVTTDPSISPPKIPPGNNAPVAGPIAANPQPLAVTPPALKPAPGPARPVEQGHSPAALPQSIAQEKISPPEPRIVAAQPKSNQSPLYPAVSPFSQIPAKPMPKPDINADPVEERGDLDELTESSWDHLAKSTPGPATPAKASPALPDSPSTFARKDPITPPVDQSRIKLPDEPRMVSSPARPALSVPAPRTWPRTHTVVSGDTLTAISYEYYEDFVHVQQILAANPQLKSPHALKIGQVLTIPEPGRAPDGPSLAAAPNTAAVDAARTPYISLVGRASDPSPADSTAKPNLPAAQPNLRPVVIGPAEKSHTVQDGDTLYSLSKKFYGDGRKWNRIFDANKSILKGDAKNLRKGMVLRIPQ